MRRVFTFFLGVTCATMASAQSSSESTDPTQVAARYAACLAVDRPAAADTFLVTEPGSAARNLAFNALIPVEGGNCAGYATAPDGTSLQIPEVILAGYIAEARYIVRYPNNPPGVIAVATPQLMTDETYNARIAAASDPAQAFPRIFGECIVGLRPTDVDALVRTRPASPAEQVVLQRLQPALGQCLWGGQSLNFSRESLRAVLADAIYYKALSADAAAAATANAEEGTSE